ncbi:SDR family NAD(P)-dependent oxidoreductase [Streptacidiphilus sp. N1-12]|uniref:SDR family NAD(P)-dependent oxidoreductase n=2 Tax=Streptacidiphilus alkalitolerans TaxID=3342712 RepID=A0ABV6X687_9ACTN
MDRYAFAGGTAIVTGAASGIGEALAGALAARGSHLVLLDRDAERLGAVADTIRAAHAALTVDTVVVDLADHEATVKAGQRLAADHPGTTLLVNNAGVALGGRFDQITLDEFDWLMEINFRAVVTLTHCLLPVLRTHPGAHLANVSSVFGIIAPAGQPAYSASKFAVRGFTEALRAELAGEGVGVTCVHPGGIATRIASSARIGSGVSQEEIAEGRAQIGRLLSIPPATAAEAILRGVERRSPRVLIGWSARIPDLIARLAPGSYTRILTLAMSRR